MAVAGENDIRISAIVSVVLAVIAIVLACVGVGTPAWVVNYSDGPNNTQVSGYQSPFYACTSPTGNCTNYFYSGETLGYTHLRQASGLSIVGILFLAFGAVGTVLLAYGAPAYFSTIDDLRYRDFHLFLGPICLFIAAVIMLAAIAEGARVTYLNGYSTNLYQTAQVLSVFSLLLSAYASGVQSLIPHKGTYVTNAPIRA